MRIYLTGNAERKGIRYVEAELYGVGVTTPYWLSHLGCFREGETCELTEQTAREAVRKRLFAEYDRYTARASELHGLLKDEVFPKVVHQ